MKTIKIVNAVVCDDVRTERNGKNILIGVYLSDIVISAAPAQIALTFWFQVDGIESDKTDLQFRSLLDGKKVNEGQITISRIDIGNRATASLGPILFTIKEEAELQFDLRRQGDTRWRKAITMPIKIRQKPPTS